MRLIIAVLLLSSLAVASELPCANVYLSDQTPYELYPKSAADRAAVSALVERISESSELCFRGFVPDSLAWQAQSHAKRDVLIAFNVGTLDDGNGVGAIGKRIEVIAYDVYVWDSKSGRVVNTGPALQWFSTERATLRFHAGLAADQIAIMTSMISLGGRSQ